MVAPISRMLKKVDSSVLFSGGGVNVEGISGGDAFECIEIGPECDYADLYIVPGVRPALPSSSGQVLDMGLLGAALHISVGSPYCGPPVEAPFSVFIPGAQWAASSGRYGYAPVGVTANDLVILDVLFHRCVPLHVAKRRPDATYVAPATANAVASGSVAETTMQVVPAYGREDFLIAVAPTISVSGTITTRIYAQLGHLSGTYRILLGTITQSTAGANSSAYEYEGKIDSYAITRQLASMNDALSVYDYFIRLRDKQ